MNDNKKSNFGIGVVVGTILGGLAALFLSPASGKENRDMVAKKLREFKTLLDEGKLDEKVKEIFGDVTDEARKFYSRITGALADKVGDLKDRVESIDRTKYNKLVDDVVHEFKKEGKFGEKVMDKLKEHLADDWNKLVTTKKV